MTAEEFFSTKEPQLQSDLWGSLGGHWSPESIAFFKSKAFERLKKQSDILKSQDQVDVVLTTEQWNALWIETIRDFHRTRGWGQVPLLKAPPKVLSEEQKQSREIFSYIWALLQAALITKTAIVYYGIKSTEEEGGTSQYWVVFWIFFSFSSLMFFAYRKSKKKG